MVTRVLDGLNRSYPQWKVNEFPNRRFSPELLHSTLQSCLPKSASYKEIGRSFEGRPIRLVSLGSGPTPVLLWSQMHGDEPTATMAIADILNYFNLYPDEAPTITILSTLRLLFLPMLNPDGAARFQRRTAQGIDMNRDALSLKTPEAKILRNIQREYEPAFAYNLHDQELSTVGVTNEITALSLLAPAFDDKKSDNDVRTRAKHVAASLAQSAQRLAAGRIARYDDAFEPRAFGDAMQQWGTSTVLIESGHAKGDPEKAAIRRINAVCTLASLHSIATGDYAASDLSHCESLPFNSKRAYDIIIRNVQVRHRSGSSTLADLGISYQVDTHSEDTPMLVDLGDLHTFVGMKEIDGGRREIPDDRLIVGKPFDWTTFFPA